MSLMMDCQHCGFHNESNGAMFCNGCGKKLSEGFTPPLTANSVLVKPAHIIKRKTRNYGALQSCERKYCRILLGLIFMSDLITVIALLSCAEETYCRILLGICFIIAAVVMVIAVFLCCFRRNSNR
eukprot:UN05056